MKILRILIIVLVLILIFAPEFTLNLRVKTYGVFLIDGSRSMDRNRLSPPDIKSPYPLKKFVFDYKRERTGIGDAILKAKERYPDAGFILLYSDGMNNTGEDPILAIEKAGLPVFVIIPEQKETGISIIKSTHFITEGDTALYYIKANKGKLLVFVEKKKIYEKQVKDAEEISIPVFMGKRGKRKILFILKGERFSDTLETYTSVLPRPSFKIISGRPDWNMGFIRRELMGKGYVESEKPDLYIFINPLKEQEDKIKSLLQKKKRIFVIGENITNLSVLPLRGYSRKEITFLEKIPMTVLSPKVVLPEATIFHFYNLEAGVVYRHGGGLFQSLMPQLWKLHLSSGGLLNKNLLSAYLDSVFVYMGVLNPHIELPVKVPEFSTQPIIFKGTPPENVVIDTSQIPVHGDTLYLPPLPSGTYRISFVFQGDTLNDSLDVFSPVEERGINIEELEILARVSKGRIVKDTLPSGIVPGKRIIKINLRHNPLIYLLIILLLATEWVIWMRRV